MNDDDAHRADGLYYRVLCWQCEETFELEEDPRGVIVTCDVCGTAARVEGDY